MRSIRFFVVALLCIALGGCAHPLESGCGENRPPDQAHRVTIEQGLWGQVWFWEGDFMPGTSCSRGKIDSVRRTIYVHTLTHREQVTFVEHGPLFSAVHSARVDSVRSDGRGFFQLHLAPGRYSLFVREGDLYYANGFDGQGHVFPVEVQPGAATRVQIDITYRASF